MLKSNNLQLSVYINLVAYDIAIWCPRHNIPFDGDIPIGIQRIKCNCINNVTNVMFEEEKKSRKENEYKCGY